MSEPREPLYRFSREEARAHDAIKEWRDSYHENCNCAFAIGEAITAHYHDNHLGDCLTPVVERFGIDRVNWVLANTIQQAEHDGRYSRDNRAWANSFYIPADENNCYFCVKSHPCLVDGLVDMARDYWKNKHFFEKAQCTEEKDYTGKLLVMKPETLKEEFRTPENQLFFATGGFGCRPNASGRRVFGIFLSDGEQTSFYRQDFLGVIADEHFPDWAREKLQALTAPNDDPRTEEYTEPDEGPVMGGM